MLTGTTRWPWWPKRPYTITERSSGNPQPSTKANVISTWNISRSTSKCANSNSALGHMMVSRYGLKQAFLPTAAFGGDGYCHHFTRPSVCPSVRPKRNYCCNHLWISDIGLKLGGMVHKTMTQISTKMAVIGQGWISLTSHSQCVWNDCNWTVWSSSKI